MCDDDDCCDECCDKCDKCCDDCEKCDECCDDCCLCCCDCDKCDEDCDDCCECKCCQECCQECCEVYIQSCTTMLNECGEMCGETCTCNAKDMCYCFYEWTSAERKDCYRNLILATLALVVCFVLFALRAFIFAGSLVVILMAILLFAGLMNYIFFNRKKTRQVIYLDLIFQTGGIAFQQYLVSYTTSTLGSLGLCGISNLIGVLIFFSFGFILRKYEPLPVKLYWYYDISSTFSDSAMLVSIFFVYGGDFGQNLIPLTLILIAKFVSILIKIYDTGKVDKSTDTLSSVKSNKSEVVNKNQIEIDNNVNEQERSINEEEDNRSEVKNHAASNFNAAAEMDDNEDEDEYEDGKMEGDKNIIIPSNSVIGDKPYVKENAKSSKDDY